MDTAGPLVNGHEGGNCFRCVCVCVCVCARCVLCVCELSFAVLFFSSLLEYCCQIV